MIVLKIRNLIIKMIKQMKKELEVNKKKDEQEETKKEIETEEI